MRTSLFLAGLLLAVVPLVAACRSDGPLADSIKEGMLESAPPGTDAKLVTLRVTGNRGRIVADEFAVDALLRGPGVLDVRRGRGRNELYVLIEGHADPYALPNALPLGDRGHVVEVLRADELPKD